MDAFKIQVADFWISAQSTSVLVSALDILPEISDKNHAKIAHIRDSLHEFCRNKYILQVQKLLASFLQESCKKPEDISKKLPRKCMISTKIAGCLQVYMVALL